MINSVLKAIRIMELFSPLHPRLSLSDVSEQLDLPKSTAHNLLNTLLRAGYIEKVGNNQYALGTAVIPLTQSVRVNVELRDRAAPSLRELADWCHESVYLTVRDGNFALYIYAIESSQRLVARTAVGDRANLHCTAVGKAILGHLPEAEVAAVVDRVGLPMFTERTITELDQLQAELKRVRERGYSIDSQEHELQTFCIGAPIFDAQGKVLGSCSVSGTDPRIIDERERAISGAVRRTALDGSRRLGFVPTKMPLILNS